ncbi:MAG: lactate racemase domain-containing protein [Planctomycetes bacterium]|nr:lactate racemase domain-containing protein [Planctomycetota bacterium]
MAQLIETKTMKSGFREVELPFGSKPVTVELPESAMVIYPNEIETVSDVKAALLEAVRNPIGLPPLREFVKPGDKVLFVHSDITRNIPRNESIEVLFEELPFLKDEDLTIILANGNHKQAPFDDYDYKEEYRKRFRFINHDSRDQSQLVQVGVTSTNKKQFFRFFVGDQTRKALLGFIPKLFAMIFYLLTLQFGKFRRNLGLGYPGRLILALMARKPTPVILNKAVVDADVVVTLGQIKPHYFMGFSGGAKSIFPGVAAFKSIKPNHLMKAYLSSRLGSISDNICRADIEEGVSFVKRLFIINTVTDGAKGAAKIVAGHYIEAQREGVAMARRVTEVAIPQKFDVVVVSESFPIALNIYQTAKTLPPAGKILNPGGVMIAVCECPEGIAGKFIVNEIIYQLGVVYSCPENHHCILVSGLDRKTVEESFFTYASDFEDAMAQAKRLVGKENPTVGCIPRATRVVPV